MQGVATPLLTEFKQGVIARAKTTVALGADSWTPGHADHDHTHAPGHSEGREQGIHRRDIDIAAYRYRNHRRRFQRARYGNRLAIYCCLLLRDHLARKRRPSAWKA
jgi:hypothetical protein